MTLTTNIHQLKIQIKEYLRSLKIISFTWVTTTCDNLETRIRFRSSHICFFFFTSFLICEFFFLHCTSAIFSFFSYTHLTLSLSPFVVFKTKHLYLVFLCALLEIVKYRTSNLILNSTLCSFWNPLFIYSFPCMPFLGLSV